MKKLLIIITIALMTPLSSFAQTQKSLIGFQGLPWGSAMSVVRAKFPEAKTVDWCKEFSISAEDEKLNRKLFKERDNNCLQITIAKYMVDTMPFKATFSFDNSGRLGNVSVFKQFLQSENPDYLLDCSKIYSNTANALTINYGEGALVGNKSELNAAYANNEAKVWVRNPTEILITQAWGFKWTKTEGKPDNCVVKVNYSQRGISSL